MWEDAPRDQSSSSPRALAAPLSRQPRRPWQDAPPERWFPHHRRRDAAAFGWYGVDASGCRCRFCARTCRGPIPIVRLASGAPKQAAEEQPRRGAPAAGRGEAANLPDTGLHDRLVNLSGFAWRAARCSPARRGSCWGRAPSCCYRLCQRRQPAARPRARAVPPRWPSGCRLALLRQLLTESVVLSVIGGISRILFAIATRTIVALMPDSTCPTKSRLKKRQSR